tara:strand:+ start:213 stop:596 length:384 start_codon:yes stop_codon:yes gene_type:complete
MSQYPSEKQFTLNYCQGVSGSIEIDGQKVYLGGVKKEKKNGIENWFVIKSDCGQYSFNLNNSKDQITGELRPGVYFGYLEKDGERVCTLNASVRKGDYGEFISGYEPKPREPEKPKKSLRDTLGDDV